VKEKKDGRTAHTMMMARKKGKKVGVGLCPSIPKNNFGRSRREFRFLGHCRKNTLRHGYYKK